MIKGIIGTILLATSPTIQKSNYYAGVVFNKVENTYAYRNDGSKYADSYSYASVFSVDNYQSVGAIKQYSKALYDISIYNSQDQDNWSEIELTAIFVTGVKSEGYIYDGQVYVNGYVQLDPQNWDYVTTAYNWNINDVNGYDMDSLESLVLASPQNYTNRKTQIANLEYFLANEGMGWDGQDYSSDYTDPNTLSSLINDINGWQTNTIDGIGSEEQNQQIKRATAYMVKLKAVRQNLTQQQINIYTQSLRNLYQSVEYNITYVGTPTTTPDYEVIDLPGLMFTILGMPFAWMSTAFNLTIFPGTPYAININHIFMMIIGVSILIFIIKKVLK